MEKPIREIIMWWESLSNEMRAEYLPQNWSGTREERHKKLRKIWQKYGTI